MSGRGFSSILSLPVVAVLLAALVLGLLFLGRSWGWGTESFYLLAVPVALAIAYLAWYRTLPYEPARPRVARPVARPVEVEEPFEDPVEEADRIDAEATHPGGEGADDAEASPAKSASPEESLEDDETGSA